jgi:hypothetical protein
MSPPPAPVEQPALAAKLREALKNQGGLSSSSSPRTGSGGFGGGSSSSSSNGTEESFSVNSNENGFEVKAKVANSAYVIVGDLENPDSLKITIAGKNYSGLKAVPSAQKVAVQNLIKKAKESASVKNK